MWVIWSVEHNAWWRAESQGYTTDFADAGLYTEARALDIARGANQYKTGTPNEIAIPAGMIGSLVAEAMEVAIRRWAHWKDGVQYVGSCGTTLERALKDIHRP